VRVSREGAASCFETRPSAAPQREAGSSSDSPLVSAPPNVRYGSNNGQRKILAGDGLSAYDPSATLQGEITTLPVGPMQRRQKSRK
jgi:hypothetical protein